MSELVWDELADRRYEAGIDRGVIYPLSDPAVVWNGLVSVSETRTRESKSYYYDAVKVYERVIREPYSAAIQAFTYPDVLDKLTGLGEVAPGVNLHDRASSRFHLSYRTLIGNPIQGLDYAYKLHLVYDLTAIPDDVTSSTVGESVAPNLLGWKVSGTEKAFWGAQAASHISIDSRKVNAVDLEALEDQLYGTASVNPIMPSLNDVLNSFI